jgi:branched-chain amino acid transport system substrate-binding protein
MQEKFSDLGYVSQGAEGSYAGIKFWAEGVRSADSAAMEDVQSAMETEMTLSVPEGDIDSYPSSHHFSHNIHLGRIGADHSVTIEETFEDRVPTWENENGNLNTDESTWENPRTDSITPE